MTGISPLQESSRLGSFHIILVFCPVSNLQALIPKEKAGHPFMQPEFLDCYKR